MAFDLKSSLRRLRLLPILILVASFGFVVRLGDTYVSFRSLSGSAYAEDAPKADTKLEEKPADTKPEDVKPSDAAAEPPKDQLKSEADAAAATDGNKEKPEIDLPSTEQKEKSGDTKWQDASDTESDNSEIKQEVFQDLTKRRADLDQKEKKLGEREALLEAAQKELDKKVKEMEGLRDELKDLLKQQTTDEAARIQSLVKIYSGMKPKDAARIFNTLDTDILMDVISSMPEAKAGAIMALMDADRAKSLTTLLAEQKKLPDVP